MFGLLKKKLAEAVKKVSKAAEKKKEDEKPVPEEVVERKGVKPPKEEKERRGIFRAIKEKTLSEFDVDEILAGLQVALLESDVAVEAAERIAADVKKSLVGKSVKRGGVEKVVTSALKAALLDVLSQSAIDLEKRIKEKDGPFLIVFAGFNGTGKTTCIAKLAHRFRKYRPVLAAGDTFRAASIEQLEEHAAKLGLEVVKHKYGADSAAVIFDAVKHAKAAGSKLVLADTAGRSHVNVNLMEELKKVVRVNKPDMKLLILDSLTGNDIYEQARLFNDAVGIDGIIMTKADVYERGGAAISATYTIKKPVLYLGVGQKYEDLKDFEPQEIVKNVLG